MNYTIGTVVFDGWKIVSELGEGSYGKVFKIQKENAGITTEAALKVMRIPKSVSDVKAVLNEGMDERSATTYFKGYVDKLMQEVAIMVTLKGHAGIVSCENCEIIPHSGTIGWDILIQMELLTPLPDYQTKHPLNEEEVRRLGCELCSALVYCHQKRGIIHRDIKPSNIFVSEAGQFKLGDFGVSKSMEGSAGFMSRQGTDGYMAPEVYLNKPYGESVDIYSLGLVLYRMMNGNRLPFYPQAPVQITFDDRQKALAKRMQGAKILPPLYASEEFAQVILKACAYEPKERYKNASEFLEALENVKIEKRMQEEKEEEEKKESILTPPIGKEEEAGTRGPFDNTYEEGTRGIFEDLPPEEEINEESEEKVVPPFSKPDEKKREETKKKSGFHLKTAMLAAAAVLVLAVGMKLMFGRGKTESEKPVNNTSVVQNEQEMQEEQTKPTVSEEQEKSEEELWQDVYENVYRSLKEGPYDFTNLTIEDYSEFFFKEGFLYNKLVSPGNFERKKEVESDWQNGTEHVYTFVPEADIEENRLITSATIDIGRNEDTKKIEYVTYFFTSEKSTKDYLKACPTLVGDYKSLKEFCEKFAITEEMVQKCEKTMLLEADYMQAEHIGTDMDVKCRFLRESKDAPLDGLKSIQFIFKNENCGAVKRIHIENSSGERFFVALNCWE